MRTITLSLVAILSLLFIATPAQADRWDPKGWLKLGEREVNGKGDHDTIVVGRHEGKFSKLTLVVEKSELDLDRLEVTFGNGEKWAAPGLNHKFRRNSTTRVIDIPGDTRIIKKVDLWYKNIGKWNNARVEVWGFKTGEAPPAKAPVFKWNAQGWQLLGERSVNYGSDKDRINVGKYNGKFEKIAVVVLDNDVVFEDLEIKFGQGAPWHPNLRHNFTGEDRAKIIDFPGDERRLKHIDFKYKTVTRGGRARVQVWAK